MKSKFKLFGVVSAAIVGLTMGLTACGGDTTVADHDHIWGEGVVTTEPTCREEGMKTYSCTVEGCTQTKTEPINKLAHKWDEGTVTKDPTCKEVGEKTFKCTNEGCTETKTEPIDKTKDHKYGEAEVTTVPDFYTKGEKQSTCADCGTVKKESIPAQADFAMQFYTETANAEAEAWQYAYLEDTFEITDPDDVSFDGSAFLDKFENGVWKGEEDAGVEIGKGTVSVAPGKIALIGYNFGAEVDEKLQANVEISFIPASGNFELHFVYADAVAQKLKAEDVTKADASYAYKTEDAIDLTQNSLFAVVIKNTATSGTDKASGELKFNITSPCIHVWDDGEITDEPTCEDSGIKTHNCINCDKTLEETIPATGHNYVDKITKVPTFKEKGEKITQCTKCEDISATEELEARVAFAEGFELNDTGEFNGWQVGTVKYNWDDESFDFNKVSAKNTAGDAYHSDSPWFDIKSDWMAIGEMMGFRYTFEEAINVDMFVHVLHTSDGVFALRWAVFDDRNNLKIGDNGKPKYEGEEGDLTKSINIGEVAANDVLYVLIGHAGGGDQCDFELVLSENKGTPQPEPAFTGANFKDDFNSTLAGESNWQVGIIDFKSDTEFSFAKLENVEGGAFKNSDPWVEFKEDWAAANNVTGIAYKFQTSATVNLAFELHCTPNETNEYGKYAIRWAVKDSDGTIKSNNGSASWGGIGQDVVVDQKDIAVANGDTLYIIITKENDAKNNQFNFSLALTQSNGQATPENSYEKLADFGEDFTNTLAGEDTGWKCGLVDFKSDSEFTLNEFTNKDSEKFHSDDPWVDFNGGWIAAKTMVGISYTFKQAAEIKFDFSITCKDNGVSAIRWALRKSDGTFKEGNGANWGGQDSNVSVSKEINVEEGDVLYILISYETTKDPNANDQKDFTFTVYEKKHA